MSFPGTDQSINCKDCRNEFVFTAGEQQWYTEHNLTDAPKRCRTCRTLKKNASQGQQAQAPVNRPIQPVVTEIRDQRDFQRAEPIREERKPRRKDKRRRDDDNEW